MKLRRLCFVTTAYITILLVCFCSLSFSQCSPATGPPPPDDYFNSGGNGAGATDSKWFIATDSINGTYKPAIIMANLPQIYYNNSRWISFSATGEHSGNRYFFYKIEFNLPCSTLCGESYNDDNSFCLDLDLYADNSIYEIYVNGIPQSGNLGGIIPLKPDPFNPVNHTESDKTAVSLCKNWKAGSDTLIIQIASSATVAGMMVQASVNPPPPPNSDTVSATICEGESFYFADSNLTKSGYYYHSFARGSGCDSNIVLHLNVHPKVSTIVNQTICEGQTFEGHASPGTYVSTYTAANGCDSVYTLHLTVQQKPKPNLATQVAICEGDSIILSPGLFSSYLWQDGSTNDSFVVKKPGNYFVTVTNSCSSAEVETLIVEGICGAFFPSAFTPNKDGQNDYFKILSDLQFQEYHLFVYNRWGQKVFDTVNPLSGWDGNFNNIGQRSGETFVWFCTYKRSGIITNRRGTIVLIR